MDLRFQDYLIEHEIQSQLSASTTPQQNGVSKRRNWTLLDTIRFMMSFAQFSDSFWGYSLETTVYILNNVPSKSVSETPYELWKGRKGSLRHFRIWGWPTHVLEQNPKKLEHRSKLCLFVSYPKEARGGLFYDPQDNKICVSTNATFLEEDHIKNHNLCSKIVLSKISTDATDIPSSSTKVVIKLGNLVNHILLKSWESLKVVGGLFISLNITWFLSKTKSSYLMVVFRWSIDLQKGSNEWCRLFIWRQEMASYAISNKRFGNAQFIIKIQIVRIYKQNTSHDSSIL